MDFKHINNPEQKKEPQKKSEQDVLGAINHYSKLSNEQLMGELAKLMGKQTPDNIKQTIERIKPLLNADQQKRLEDVLKNVGHN